MNTPITKTDTGITVDLDAIYGETSPVVGRLYDVVNAANMALSDIEELKAKAEKRDIEWIEKMEDVLLCIADDILEATHKRAEEILGFRF